MQIKEAAQKLNISTRAIRFYEEKGLLNPAKSDDNRYRAFEERDIWRLQTIVALREAGMAVSDIRKALTDIDEHGQETLLRYLELQQSILMSQWLEIKQTIGTTESMISLLKTRRKVPLEDIYRLAESSKRLREQRKTWYDRWNFDRLAATHDEQVANDPERYPEYERALAAVVERISPVQGERGLDVGTGTGNLAGLFLSQGVRMAGVDQSKEMLRISGKKFPDLETRPGNLMAIPYLDKQFDFIVSAYAFRHLTEEQQRLALDEMHRVLKPDGRVCIADTQLTELTEWFGQNGYSAEHLQIDSRLHIVYAVHDH